jgi:molybdopterin-biosynthesis enzyme MoeA-like protein
VLDGRYAALHGSQRQRERAAIVQGAMEATLTPLMEAIEARYPDVKVFSLPSVDHPTLGRHIELGVKGGTDAVDPAFAELCAGLTQLGATFSTNMVR